MALLIEMLIIVALLVGIALVAVGRGGALREDDPDRVDTRVPPPGEPVLPDSVDAFRFGMAFRGYRMDEVDDALDRLRDEIAGLRAQLTTREVAPTTAAVLDAPAPADTTGDIGTAPLAAPAQASRFAPSGSGSDWVPPAPPAQPAAEPVPDPGERTVESEPATAAAEPASESEPAPARDEPVWRAEPEPEPEAAPAETTWLPEPESTDLAVRPPEETAVAAGDGGAEPEPESAPSWSQWAPTETPESRPTPLHEIHGDSPATESTASDALGTPAPAAEEEPSADEAEPDVPAPASSQAAGWEGSAPITWERHDPPASSPPDDGDEPPRA